jgi:hypothetical protein
MLALTLLTGIPEARVQVLTLQFTNWGNTLVDLGSMPDVPTPHGGLTFTPEGTLRFTQYPIIAMWRVLPDHSFESTDLSRSVPRRSPRHSCSFPPTASARWWPSKWTPMDCR